MTSMNAYQDALRQIPRGQTRSFMELAAMAGRPGAARAAGRALAQCTSSSQLPCHRVVSSQGRVRDEDQLRRLRREGARPRARETIANWAARTNTRFVGNYPTHQFAARDELGSLRWNPDLVDGFPDEASATARGFSRWGTSTQREEPLPTNRTVAPKPGVPPLRDRLDRIDWASVRAALAHDGGYHLEKLLTPFECAATLNESTTIERFERSVDMLPRGYGVGSYHYYREPLPTVAHELRERLYRELAPSEYPATLDEFWEVCRRAGQKRASSILIGYGKGGVNHPHRDVYGPVFFPFQALVTLSKRGRDFTGGEFYIEDEVGSRPKKTFKVTEGGVVVFATRERYPDGERIPLRHGMTPVTRGRRYGVGVVFHLAE